VLLITHDLGVVAEVRTVAVMYTGRIVEESPVDELFARPKHPYTEGLLRSVPKLSSAAVAKQERLETIEGTVPSPTTPARCHFAPRCPYRPPRCTEEEIPLYDLEGDVRVRCVLFDLAAAAVRRIAKTYPQIPQIEDGSLNRQDAKVAKERLKANAVGWFGFVYLALLASWRLIGI
jgi:oligopeptide/dipeptide ABC transporter ATP-binding protein